MARQFLKVNHKLDFGHQTFMAFCAKANIGTSQCFGLYKEFVGGFENVGATSVDFQNQKCYMLIFMDMMHNSLLIIYLRNRSDVLHFFTGMTLMRITNYVVFFWADPVARLNFAVFGDVVSFDATYSTNRYVLYLKFYVNEATLLFLFFFYNYEQEIQLTIFNSDFFPLFSK